MIVPVSTTLKKLCTVIWGIMEILEMDYNSKTQTVCECVAHIYEDQKEKIEVYVCI